MPGPMVDQWEWQLRGACRGEDTQLFSIRRVSADRNGRGARRPRRRSALGVPLLARCLTHALISGEPYGVWGGLSEAEREALPAVLSGQFPSVEARR
jgi:WhiB family redox-sensing transcriptional regulator